MAKSTKSVPVVAPKAVKAAKASKSETVAVEFTSDGRRKTLRAPQIVLLTALSKAKSGSMTRKALVEKCPGVGLSEHMGTIDGTKNKYTVGLVEQKLVTCEEHEDTGIVYTITAAGKKILGK